MSLSAQAKPSELQDFIFWILIIKVLILVTIGGLQKSSLIDYPEKISAIVFTQGCNFKCPYCHNPELISSATAGQIGESEIIDFLKTRIGKLDGVVITGGEPTLHRDLSNFIEQIKSLGFSVKLDTNGTNYGMLKSLIDKGLIDYVAMDIKAPIEKYAEITGTESGLEDVQKSINLLKNSSIPYEFRTTVVKSQLEPDDFVKIAELISGCEKYYLQRFLPTKTLNRFFMNQTTYSDEEFDSIIEKIRPNIKFVDLR